MTIVFEAYTAPPSRTSATLGAANGAPRGAFAQTGEVALRGRQSGPKFSAAWELTGTLSGSHGSPKSALFAASALRGANGSPSGRFYQSAGALAATNGGPHSYFGNGPALVARTTAASGGFAAAPAIYGVVLQGSMPYPSWSSTTTYAETWSGLIGVH